LILSVLLAGIATVAFGVLFNIHGKTLLYVGLNGAIGFFIYSLSIHWGISSYTSMFFASTGMTIYAEIAARVRKTPASLYLIAALIPIVPGGGIYRFVLYLLQGIMEEALSTGVITLMETGGIALGVIVVSSVIKMTPRRR